MDVDIVINEYIFNMKIKVMLFDSIDVKNNLINFMFYFFLCFFIFFG